MDAQTVRKFKWFWAWQDDKEEAWLSGMAQTGWHLKWPAMPGFYIFEAGAPRQDVYQLDYVFSNKDTQNYLQLFQDAGWQHVGAMGGWQYFRKTRQGNDDPEIYTDPESKVQKYRRLLNILVVFFPIYIILLTNSPSDATHLIYQVGKLLGGFFMILFVIAMIKIYLRMNQLKRL